MKSQTLLLRTMDQPVYHAVLLLHIEADELLLQAIAIHSRGRVLSRTVVCAR